MTSEKMLVEFIRDKREEMLSAMNREGNISFETKDELEECIDDLYKCLYNLDING